MKTLALLFFFSPFCSVGCDAAFIGPNENQYAVLDDDKTSLALYILPGAISQEVNENNGALDTNSFAEANAVSDRGPLQFFFETEVDRIFSSPLGGLSKFSLIYIITKELLLPLLLFFFFCEMVTKYFKALFLSVISLKEKGRKETISC